MFRSVPLFLGILFTIFWRGISLAQAETPFEQTYKQWIDPDNHFVDFWDDQARVIFIGSEALSDPDKPGPRGTRPTVSEGMGYGLLLSYAADDQENFDKFLRYILGVANNQGCSVFNGTSCLAPCPFLMPWIVNDKGEPFWFQASKGSPSYFSSGSASDADFQIAWAIYLASQKVGNGWADSTFNTSSGEMDYKEIFDTMGLQIRLNDVDLHTLLYNPGNQWGDAGKKVLYPGYFTPQAFLALDNAPVPDVSTACPDHYPNHSPANSLQLIFKNNITKTVSIDYLGGYVGPNGSIDVGPTFVPKTDPNVPNGYTVAALTEATAYFNVGNSDSANATIQAALYDENGVVYSCNYYIEYSTAGGWKVTDKDPNPQSSYCQQTKNLVLQNNKKLTLDYIGGNVVYVYLSQPDIEDLTFKFSDVLTSNLNAVKDFNNTYNTGLMPNVMQLVGKYPDGDDWSNLFAYDACRFALWSADFLQNNPQGSQWDAINESLNLLLSPDKGIANFIDKGTLPSGGINALTQQAIGNWDQPAIPLNATLMTAASVLQNTEIYNQLSPSVFNYALPDNTPKGTDGIGDSTPYYNAATMLLSLAILEKRFPPIQSPPPSTLTLKSLKGMKIEIEIPFKIQRYIPKKKLKLAPFTRVF